LVGFIFVFSPKDSKIISSAKEGKNIVLITKGTNPILKKNGKKTDRIIKGKVTLIKEKDTWKILENNWTKNKAKTGKTINFKGKGTLIKEKGAWKTLENNWTVTQTEK